MFSHAQHFVITESQLTNVNGHQFNTAVTYKYSAVSLGDIFCVFNLARKLVRTLSESRGSSREYQDLILEIDHLSHTLEHLNQTITLSARGINPIPSSIANAIVFALSRCRTLIGDFMERIKGYQNSLKKGGSGSRMRDSWRKMGWGFFKAEEVVELRNRLMEQKLTINTMIMVSNSKTLERVEQIASRHEQVTKQHDVTLTSIQCSIERLPQILGHPWEGGLSDDRKPLWLVDVLGTRTLLPLELCANWEVFDGLLKLYFKNRAGREYVERGDYDLTGHKDNEVIKPAMWESRVEPGMTINMSIILRLLGFKDSRQCPSCHMISTSAATSNGGEIMCSFCQTSFRVSDGFIEEVEDTGPTESNHDPSDSDVSTSKPKQTPVVEDETRFFRRIHVIATKTRRLPSQSLHDSSTTPGEPSEWHAMAETSNPLTSRTLDDVGTPMHPIDAALLFLHTWGLQDSKSADDQSFHMSEISKMLGREWSAMDMSEKQFWLKQASRWEGGFDVEHPVVEAPATDLPQLNRSPRSTSSGSHDTFKRLNPFSFGPRPPRYTAIELSTDLPTTRTQSHPEGTADAPSPVPDMGKLKTVLPPLTISRDSSPGPQSWTTWLPDPTLLPSPGSDSVSDMFGPRSPRGLLDEADYGDRFAWYKSPPTKVS